MPALNFSDAWRVLPKSTRLDMQRASTGWRRLARLGGDALRLAANAGGDEAARLRALAADILLWAHGENPLCGPLAAEILAAPDLPIPAPARASLSAVAGHWRAPAGREGGQAYFERLAAKRETARLARFLAEQIRRDPGGLYWRDKALGLSIYCGPGALADELAAAALSGLENLPGLSAAALGLTAQTAFLRGEADSCADALSRLSAECGPAFGAAFAPARRGLAWLDADEDERALPEILAALRLAPWQAGLTLAAADALTGARRAVVPPPGPALIMLYTWNKAADLDVTLASLFASDLTLSGGGRARVMVLNNGGTDDTRQVLDRWTLREGILRVDLPVNIGAPAARNWLAATPEARAARTLVYLDDDVDLPGDWLGRLGAALAAMPEAGVAGCKVADHQAPRLLQNVAGRLAIPRDAPDDRPDLDFRSLAPNPFRLLDAHLQGPDWGLFDFIGPADSVTGCCHMFPREALDEPFDRGGGFSLALSPSQYDDFERDLRMLSGGKSAVYQGFLRVRHRKRSGLAAQGGAAQASANGNRYKMQTMHSRQEVAGFIAAQAETLGQAMARALGVLDQAEGRP